MSVLAATDYAAQLHALQQILLKHGPRIGELLSLTVGDVDPPGLVHIAGSKGSNARTIDCAVMLAPLAHRLALSPAAPLFTVSYRAVYEHVKAGPFDYVPPGHTNARVTHAFRARYMQQLADLGQTAQQIADAVGLKNPDVVPIYLDTI